MYTENARAAKQVWGHVPGIPENIFQKYKAFIVVFNPNIMVMICHLWI